MNVIRKILAAAVAAACIAVIAPTSSKAAAQTASPADDPPQACTWQYDTVDVNNNHVIKYEGGLRALADFRIQRMRATGCYTYLRNMVNIRCQGIVNHRWVPVACGHTNGYTTMVANTPSELWIFNDPWYFRTTGSDGTTTVYGTSWARVVPGACYFGNLEVTHLNIAGYIWTDLGVRANSHWWPNYC